MNVWGQLIERPAVLIQHRRDPAPRNRDRRNEPKRPERARKLHNLPKVQTPWSLNPHQALCMPLMAAGLTNGEIAAKLGVGIKSVEAHLAGAYDRMQEVEDIPINRVRAAVLWDRHTRPGA